jgi:hypothetical protein
MQMNRILSQQEKFEEEAGGMHSDVQYPHPDIDEAYSKILIQRDHLAE